MDEKDKAMSLAVAGFLLKLAGMHVSLIMLYYKPVVICSLCSYSIIAVLLRLITVGFPAPAFYGAAIDSTCVVQQGSCDRKGACLLYDNDGFRIRLHALPLIGKFVSTWLYCMALYFSVRRESRHGTTSLPPPETSPTPSPPTAASRRPL